MTVTVAVRRLPGARPGAAAAGLRDRGRGGDGPLREPAPARAGLTLASGERALGPSGLAFAIPEGFEIQVRPRSGLALRHGVTLVNSPGTIDSDYRGEVGVILVNHGAEPFTVEHGMRIAQLVLAPVSRLVWREAPALDDSARGAGGFGSTGTAGRGP